MILVTGANGTVGGEVVRQLAAAGAPARGLVRSQEKAAALEGLGVEAVIGDMADPGSLDAPLDGIAHAFLVSSIPPNQVELQGNFVDACVRAGVEHLVKLSVFGTSAGSPVGFIRWHAETERQIEASGLGLTHLRPNNFFQNVFFSANSIREQGAFYAPLGEARVSSVDVRDIAAVAVETLTKPGYMGRTLEITGPEAIDQTDVAEQLGSARGEPVQYVEVPVEAAIEAMTGAGMPEFLAADLGALYGDQARGGWAEVTGVVEDVTGRPPRAFKDFAQDAADQFR